MPVVLQPPRVGDRGVRVAPKAAVTAHVTASSPREGAPQVSHPVNHPQQVRPTDEKTGVVLRQRGGAEPQATLAQKLAAAQALLTHLPTAHPRSAMLRLALTRRDQALLDALLLELGG